MRLGVSQPPIRQWSRYRYYGKRIPANEFWLNPYSSACSEARRSVLRRVIICNRSAAIARTYYQYVQSVRGVSSKPFSTWRMRVWRPPPTKSWWRQGYIVALGFSTCAPLPVGSTRQHRVRMRAVRRTVLTHKAHGASGRLPRLSRPSFQSSAKFAGTFGQPLSEFSVACTPLFEDKLDPFRTLPRLQVTQVVSPPLVTN